MKRFLLGLLLLMLTCGNAFADNSDPIAVIGTPENGLDVEQTIDITGVAFPSRDSATLTWRLEYGSGQSPAAWTQLSTGNTAVGNSHAPQDQDDGGYGFFHGWNTTLLPDGYYTIRLTVTDGANKTAIDQAMYYFDNLHVYGNEEDEPGSTQESFVSSVKAPVSKITTNENAPDHGPTSAPTGPAGVPFGGTYIYYTPTTWGGLGTPLHAIPSQWRVRNGRIVSSGQTWCKVIWDTAPKAEGYISYVTAGHKRSYAIALGIWEVAVNTNPNSVDRETINNNAAVVGLPDVTVNDIKMALATTKTTANHGNALTYSSTVFAYGPPSGIGLSSLKAGYLQTVNVSSLFLIFNNNRLQNHYYLSGRSFRDSATANVIWIYDGIETGGTSSFPYTHGFDVVGLSSGVSRIAGHDSPLGAYPVKDLISPYPTLQSVGHVMNFSTSVQVATTQQDKSGYNFVPIRQFHWDLNMSGNYVGGTYNGQYVPGPTVGLATQPWGPVTTQSIYTGETPNDIGKRGVAAWYGPLLIP